MKFLSSVLLFLAPISLALPTNVVDSPAEDSIEARQCYVRCGSTCYTSAQVTGARNSGYNYIRQGGTAGGSSYPHRYNNYEGFDFLVSGPYYEFPLRTGGAYTGGSPGADRVVFNGNGQRAGEITHTGASGNAFVACSGW
ncbi:ribonuclease-domain-containing protein [Corynespora cassiicola Philippines]|uniref:ribonuclease T1 n=1 Tax=Corynespora cassiicola Philippines TaxID=1448308 RepID=A0A2T2NLT6_CORCC|nr:ribonuclease-domain-containing protein [Corynespora cassiicola Philippines]